MGMGKCDDVENRDLQEPANAFRDIHELANAVVSKLAHAQKLAKHLF